MIRKLSTALAILTVPIGLVVVLGGCTFRDGRTWDTSERPKEEAVEENWATKEDVAGLEKRVSTLEQRTEEINDLAQQANKTAEKALKCCRKEYTVVMTEEIYFDFNKSDIRDDAHAALDRVAEKLKSDPDLIAELKGFTDGIGNPDYNIVLGQKRADAARTYLVTRHQIAMERLAIRTFGEDQPVAPNDSEEGRAKNRRVVIDVLGF